MSTTASEFVHRLLGDEGASHAVLLSGPQGGGVEQLAYELAAGWTCLTPSEGRACGECAACRTLASGNPVDIAIVKPTGKTAIIGLGAILERDGEQLGVPVRSFLRTPPIRSKRKVVLMERADRLNHSAANALLKVLEEPPGFAKFVLWTDSPSNVPATILSRCQVVVSSLESADSSQLTDAERVLSEGIQGRVEELRKNPAWTQDFWEFCESLRHRVPAHALVCSEKLRQLAEIRADELGGARQAQAECVRQLGLWWRFALPHQPQALARIVESHRRIIGNVQAGTEMDALFSRILRENS